MGKTPVRNEHLQLVTIYEISKILGESLDLPKMLHKILNVFAIYLETRQGTISLVHESGELHLVGASGMSGDEFRKCRECMGEGITGRIFHSGMPIVIPDISKEPQFLHCHTCTGEMESQGRRVAYIGVPIKAGREVIGVMGIERVIFDPGHRCDEDVHLLKMVGNLIGQAVRLHGDPGAARVPPVVERRAPALARRSERYSLDNVVGISAAMQQVFAEVHQSAPSRSTILLRGESGTGKEVIARSIHHLSPRKDGPFIKVNCAALSETLLESELFGHEKGSFTGAQFERKGRFELANGGTLFLDEIGEISLAFQAKLLRVLQEREFERVGGNRPIKVDVRLITATNRDLERAVAAGDFRSDLYYRINVVSIFMPPLRERREDIPSLVSHFLARYNGDNDRELEMSAEAMHILKNCYWPGNVRELENCIERTATMTRGGIIREMNVPCQHNRCLTQILHELPGEGTASPAPRAGGGPVSPTPALGRGRGPGAAVAGAVGARNAAVGAGTVPWRAGQGCAPAEPVTAAIRLRAAKTRHPREEVLTRRANGGAGTSLRRFLWHLRRWPNRRADAPTALSAEHTAGVYPAAVVAGCASRFPALPFPPCLSRPAFPALPFPPCLSRPAFLRPPRHRVAIVRIVAFGCRSAQRSNN